MDKLAWMKRFFCYLADILLLLHQGDAGVGSLALLGLASVQLMMVLDSKQFKQMMISPFYL